MLVKVITDSACDLPQHMIDDEGIEQLPLIVHINDTDYYDQETIVPSTLYKMMREGKVAKTAQVPTQRMKEAFESCAKNEQPCVYITLSSQLSGTYQSAVLVRDEIIDAYPNANITIIDSKGASTGQGLITYLTAKYANAGQSYQDVVQQARQYTRQMEYLFTVGDLEFLFRGGRVSRTSAFVGGLLNIKPILHVEDGRLVPLHKVRGEKKALKTIVDMIGERSDQLNDQTIAISHGDDLEKANQLKDLIQQTYKPKDIFVTMIGATIGAHAGPGTLAVFFLNNRDQSL